jgi:FkbM family methyltransferase
MPHTKLRGFTVEYPNADEFHQIKRELYTYDSYYFETDKAQPVIVDIGAHIGLATLYFKSLYAGAIITAYEPHPVAFKYLEKNIWDNNLSDVTTINQAVSDHKGNIHLHVDPTSDLWLSTSSVHPGAWTGDQRTEAVSVPCVSLRDVLENFDGPIDLLKMDIEGGEQQVLFSAMDQLGMVKHAFVEFHTRPDQSLVKLVDSLNDRGLKVECWQHGKPVKPKLARGLVMVEWQV